MIVQVWARDPGRAGRAWARRDVGPCAASRPLPGVWHRAAAGEVRRRRLGCWDFIARRKSLFMYDIQCSMQYVPSMLPTTRLIQPP